MSRRRLGAQWLGTIVPRTFLAHVTGWALVRPDGSPVAAEPAFAALRDARPTDIAAIESRRSDLERIFTRLEQAGIARDDLVLAFDFVTQSAASMTAEMLSIREQGFAWLDAQAPGVPTFAVDETTDTDCALPGVVIRRQIRGTFQAPLFLAADPVASPLEPALLNRDANGAPVASGVMQAPFAVAIPCSARGDAPQAELVIGHGLFHCGPELLAELTGLANGAAPVAFPLPDLIAGATNWSGYSSADFVVLTLTIGDVNRWPSLVDRLRQGQLNTLILARMMKTAAFNAHPAFQSAGGAGLLAGPAHESFFAGQSIGGTQGAVFAALSPDVERVILDKPFSFALFFQRSGGSLFQIASGIADPLQVALTVRLIADLSARADLAGHATHITGTPLPDTNAKRVLVTMGLFDQAVPNLNAEFLARTLGLPSLAGSAGRDLPQIPDLPGPLPSALAINDFGAFDPSNPAHEPFIRPLANVEPACSLCDPHGISPLQVPALAPQFLGFLRPGGMVENFCNGLCDGAEPAERAYGWPTRCDPFDPWWVPFDFCG